MKNINWSKVGRYTLVGATSIALIALGLYGGYKLYDKGYIKGYSDGESNGITETIIDLFEEGLLGGPE